MPMISSVQPSVQHSDNRALNWGSQQWTNLTSSLKTDSKDQWSLAKKVGAFFLFVLGAWVLSRIFRGSHTVTISSNSSHVDRSANTVVNKDAIEFSNGPSSLLTIKDSGVLKQEERKIASFEDIELKVPGLFTIVQGTHAKISCSADQNIFDKLQDIVSAKKLIIQAQPNTSFETKQPIKYTIVVPENISLKEIRVSATAQVVIPFLDSAEFCCIVEDAGKVVVQGGQVTKQGITVNGTGSYDARSVLANHSLVVIQGTGNADVKAREILDVNIKGTGTCTCYGKRPQQVNEEVSLTGKLIFSMDIPAM